LLCFRRGKALEILNSFCLKLQNSTNISFALISPAGSGHSPRHLQNFYGGNLCLAFVPNPAGDLCLTIACLALCQILPDFVLFVPQFVTAPA
jgi:hypothetical protein